VVALNTPRDQLQTIFDLATARLRDDRVTDENVRSDLQQIANAAGYALTIIGWTPPDEAPTKPQTPEARRKSSGSMQAVRPGGLAARVDAILEEGKEPKP
jgi:hypothetical protein